MAAQSCEKDRSEIISTQKISVSRLVGSIDPRVDLAKRLEGLGDSIAVIDSRSPRDLPFEDVLSAPRQKRQQQQDHAKTINWSAIDPKCTYEIRECFEKSYDAEIHICQDSWKKDLPQLCALLGLKNRVDANEFLSSLKSSNAFSLESVAAAGFVPSRGTKEIVLAENILETGSLRVKVRIPMQYEEGMAAGKSNRRRELELFVKNELADTFGVPEQLLNPEIHLAEIRSGSVLVTMILSTSALMLIFVGMNITQTPTWYEKQFEILMAFGGAAAGSAFGVVTAGPIGAAFGAIIGTTCALTTAWFVGREVSDAAARAKAYLTFIGTVIVIIIRHLRHKDP